MKGVVCAIVFFSVRLMSQGSNQSFPVQTPTGIAIAGESIVACTTQPSQSSNEHQVNPESSKQAANNCQVANKILIPNTICIVEGNYVTTLNGCLGSLPRKGGRVFFDPSGATISSTTTNPWAGIAATSTHTYLGAGTFRTDTTWSLNANGNNGNIIEGIGRGAGNFNTTIQAGDNFSNGPVVQLSNTTLSFGSRIESLAIDCNNRPRCTGIQNLNGQEQTQIKNVLLQGFNNIGLELSSAGGGQHQNSGPYEDMEVYCGASATSSTIGIKAGTKGNGSIIRGMNSITVNCTNASILPDVGIQVNDSGTYSNIHCDGVVTCVQVNASGVTINSINCVTQVTTCISMSAGLANVTITNITVGAGVRNLLVDHTNSNICTVASEGQSLNLYSFGGGTAPVGLLNTTSRCALSVSRGIRGLSYWVTNPLVSATAPTIFPATGFNSGSMDATPNGTAAFTVTIGTGRSNSTGTISLPTVAHGWNCTAINQSRAALVQQTANSANSSTLTNYGTNFSATNWTNGDTILVQCLAR